MRYLKKINKLIVFCIIIYIPYNSYGQNDYASISKLQGNWMFYKESKKGFSEIRIFRGNKYIGISFFDERKYGYIAIDKIMEYRFSNESEKLFENINDLDTVGRYLYLFPIKKTNINKLNIDLLNGSDEAVFFNYNGEEFEDKFDRRDYFYVLAINGERVFYYKVDSIPSQILTELKKKKEDWNLYMSFMDMYKRKIINDQTIIYKNMNVPNSKYLKKNDSIEILEIYNDWYKVQYHENEIGWLKKDDVEPIPEFPTYIDVQLKSVIVKSSKATLFTKPDLVSKMYLVKGDKAEVLEETTVYYKIRFEGKKVIEAWIKKEDVE